MPTSFSHRPARHWLQIDIAVPEKFIEYVSHELTRITGNGVQQLSKDDKEIIIGYLEKNDTYPAARQELDTFLSEFTTKLNSPLDLNLSTLVEENWAENWKENYKPSRITDNITVKPTWETYSPAAGEIVIEIDPGMAFGTGLHSSTRLALTFIDQLFTTPKTSPRQVLDVGTGTGILAIAAAKLGAEKVTATDNDIDAVVAARDNIQQNGVGNLIDCSERDLSELADSYGLVIANITADILSELCPELVKKMSQGGHLILAGILKGAQADKVKDCFQAAALNFVAEKIEGRWISLLFTKPPVI
ncbi:MAG: 50S ribosomal protein L11 methyltransferase [Proteobacteria bacterium]|nr:50S ribosomal protein L11 methyltransferase [Pseudomonadota bacterium]MBU1641459.1 50S ribosomal protein L11 methyltransferase [Pseudomonadota bacterium]